MWGEALGPEVEGSNSSSHCTPLSWSMRAGRTRCEYPYGARWWGGVQGAWIAQGCYILTMRRWLMAEHGALVVAGRATLALHTYAEARSSM